MLPINANGRAGVATAIFPTQVDSVLIYDRPLTEDDLSSFNPELSNDDGSRIFGDDGFPKRADVVKAGDLKAWIEITQSQFHVVSRPLNDKDKINYSEAYSKYANRQYQNEYGTKLDNTVMDISPAEINILQNMGIYTLQELAATQPFKLIDLPRGVKLKDYAIELLRAKDDEKIAKMVEAKAKELVDKEMAKIMKAQK